MNISETKLLDLLPECMRQDRIIKGFSAAWGYVQGKITAVLPLVNLFDNLELLTESQLDQIAEAMQIPWYNTEYTVEKKINLIRHFEQVCFKLGTIGSIQNVAEGVYGEAEVEDWYEYEGREWGFKIFVDYGDYTTVEALARLTRMVRDIRPAKSTLSPVEFLKYTDVGVTVGSATTLCQYFPPIKDTRLD